jgi:hypothetical protein
VYTVIGKVVRVPKHKANKTDTGSTDETPHFYLCTRFEVFTAVKIQVQVFWVVTPCNDVVGYQRFRNPCCLHLQGMMAKKIVFTPEPNPVVLVQLVGKFERQTSLRKPRRRWEDKNGMILECIWLRIETSGGLF